MEPLRTYENFPLSLVAVSVLVSLLIYAAGAVIIAGFGYMAAAVYLLVCLANEVHVLKMSCVDCWYCGKRCAFGRGRIVPLLFKQGDPRRFAAKTISWKEFLPDLFVALIPFVAGTALLIRSFSWATAVLLALLIGLVTQGNYLVRSRIACKYCKQRELGCPAEKLFGKQ